MTSSVYSCARGPAWRFEQAIGVVECVRHGVPELHARSVCVAVHTVPVPAVTHERFDVMHCNALFEEVDLERVAERVGGEPVLQLIRELSAGAISAIRAGSSRVRRSLSASRGDR